MDSTLLDIGIIHIKWYSFLIFIGIIVATLLIKKEGKKKKVDNDYLIDLIFYGVIIGILGARLYYVIFNLNYYLSNPIEIIQIWNGGLAIHGGIIAASLFFIIYTRKKKKNFLLTVDILSPGLIIAQAIGRWGNFFNQEAFGRIITKETLLKLHLPNFIINGMYIEGAYREPTFLYESFFSLLGFLILILLRKTKKIKTGQLTGTYLCWYGIERLIIESFRSDSLMLGSLKIAQLVSILLIILGSFLIFRKNKKLYHNDTIDIK